jgi:hypothetical protein
LESIETFAQSIGSEYVECSALTEVNLKLAFEKASFMIVERNLSASTLFNCLENRISINKQKRKKICATM